MKGVKLQHSHNKHLFNWILDLWLDGGRLI